VTLALAVLVIVGAVVAIVRRLEVRLVLLAAALVIGMLAGKPTAIIREFFETFANERYVVPLCTAMGFAYALRHTGCDQHLVHLLIKPLTRLRPLLIPGTVIVGFIVNIPIISQTSSAVTLGPVVIPILQAARIPAVTIGAALLLGCSIGGELLNPGAPELRTVVTESQNAVREMGGKALTIDEHDCVRRILPLNLIGLMGATGVFWWLARRESVNDKGSDADTTDAAKAEAAFKINPIKAAVPFLPLVLLLLTGPPLNVISVPKDWLVQHSSSESTGLFNSRLIGLAMLIGVVAAALVAPRKSLTVPREFFEGAGYAFANIVSLIVVANCFGLAVKEIGLAALLGDAIRAFPLLLLPAGGLLPLGFGFLCGSGMATTQSLFGFFTGPALAQGEDLALVGAVVAIASAAGRTISPVAAVVLMCAAMTGTSPFDLIRRLVVPVLFGMILVVAAAITISLTG
jgi:DcuC family C4-dicarboxylate transporter